MKRRISPLPVLLFAALLPALQVQADESSHAGHGAMNMMDHGPEQKPWGIAGQGAKVDRTVEIRMGDNMRFTPQKLQVRQGETIRFVHHNDGKLMHEFVLGTRQTLDEHAAEMLKGPGMAHGEAYMAHVAPAAQGEMIWTFNRVGEFEFACLIAGHYQAGMRGSIEVLAD
ncbi:plastocyanin/azurin family copper-binding protein [Ectopseudomonas composti]|uniref:cupredoxin domain-containing protein n=1 Tax=Ectopseudomonas composti TaxID=658457 RepID=UPI0007733EF7|nr:cupredoxin family protein [Pseudomonas composti]